MAFDWIGFLDLARHLREYSGLPADSVLVEAAYRTCVSRAYYAAFCHVRNHAESKLGFSRSATGRDHSLLREHLKKRDPFWLEVAEDLEDLQKWRGQCDYDDRVDELDVLVQNALETAEKVIKQCSQIS